MGIEQFGENQRATGQREDALKEGYHFDNLFDQNEDESGEKINLATGKRIRNDIDTPQNIVRVSEKDLTENDQVVKELEDDITTKWFLSQGFDKFGNKIIKDDEEPKKAA